ncbi:MAG: VWA domain-containing protein, partial [Myxococcota bacterium]
MERHVVERQKTRAMSLLASVWIIASGCAGTQQVEDAPLLLDWSVESSHPYVLASGETESVLHVDLEAVLPEDEQRRIPLNISLVLDHSGSMSGEQMTDARDAVLYMLSQLKPDDRVSVVVFSTQVELLQAQDEWEEIDHIKLRDKLALITPRGTTAMYRALQQGLQQVRSRYEAGSINRVILLSDGIPNDGSQIVNLATNARSGGVAITTMGLGPYYNEDL